MNKFTGIKFPFFALRMKPYQVKYALDKIYVQRTFTGHLETVDDKTIEGDYFARLATMNQRLKFDYTCKNLQELVYSKTKWGMDCEANPFDLSKPMTVKSYCHKIVKVRENMIWVKNISYPFEIPTYEKLEIKENIYATLVKIDNEWFLREFSYDTKNIPFMRI
jgi:hypothetical protein